MFLNQCPQKPEPTDWLCLCCFVCLSDCLFVCFCFCGNSDHFVGNGPKSKCTVVGFHSASVVQCAAYMQSSTQNQFIVNVRAKHSANISSQSSAKETPSACIAFLRFYLKKEKKNGILLCSLLRMPSLGTTNDWHGPSSDRLERTKFMPLGVSSEQGLGIH